MSRSLPIIPLTPITTPRRGADLLRWPVVGPILRWRRFRTSAQLVLLAVAGVVVGHGLAGPDLAPKNLATVLSWIHYRGLLIGALLIVGNVFCGACPMVLVRDVGRRFHPPSRPWPRWVRGKRLALVLFVVVLFAYERFDLWALPSATAWLVIGYFLAALATDLTFRGAAFCKHVCPVGQFNFIASTLSPLELRVRAEDVCRRCTTADCVKGRRETLGGRVAQRGCELGLFLPTKVGNLDCTFCLDCVQACPHDNVAIASRVPGEELVDDQRRSVIGRLARRPDLAALAMVFTFGALLNAFAMTSPSYMAESRLAALLGTDSETLVLAVLFGVALVVAPLALCGFAAIATRQLSAPGRTVSDIAVRYSYTLVPVGAGVWLAHYGFHYLTGAGTVLPVVQGAVADLTGHAWLGEPDWRWIGVRSGLVFPFQISVVVLGAIGALAMVQAISERDHGAHATGAALPWATLVITLAVLAGWILAQPMEMRGASFG